METSGIGSFVRRAAVVLSSGKKPVYYASVLIGIAAGLAALLMKLAVHAISGAGAASVDLLGYPALRYALPAVGIALTVAFTRYVIKEDIGHGVAKVLKARARNKGVIAPHNMYSSIVGCSLTVGFGGSVGLEAPVMYTGSAIGSNIARWFRLEPRTKTILVGCGSAAAVAAIYEAPIAGIVFALEVLMLDSTPGNKLPLIVSSITGALVSMLATGTGITYSFAVHETFNLANVPYYLGLGVFCGLLALHLHKTSRAMESLLKRARSPWARVLAGGLGVGVMVAILPPLFGEGMSTLEAVLSGRPLEPLAASFFASAEPSDVRLIAFLAAVLVLKPFAAGLTTGAGGVGGVFAPSLFMGGIAGYLFAHTARLFGAATVSEANFALTGMAALLAALMHAPLTGIFLIAELTGGYELFIPLMIASASAYGVHRAFSSHSVYTENLAAEDSLVTWDKDAAALMELDPYSLLDADAARLSPDEPLSAVRKLVLERPAYLFAVVDGDGRYLGDLRFDDIRNRLIDDDCAGCVAGDFATKDPRTLSLGMRPAEVLEQLDGARDGALPVVDDLGVFRGFLWREVVLEKYRKLMISMTKED